LSEETKLQNKKRLLAVFAHPDDESFGIGGSLALYARDGVEIHLICATRGEAGTIPDSMAKKADSVAILREAELRCAGYHLGLADIQFLDFRDSGMKGSPDNQHPNALAAAPIQDVSNKITHLIRSIRPHVVITHGPKGGYLHPDHIALHKATVKAFKDASDPDHNSSDLPPYAPQKLYFTLIPLKFLRPLARVLPLFGIDLEHFGQNKDINLIELLEDEYPIHTRINIGSVYKIKERASACHASQLNGGMRRTGLLSLLLRFLTRTESYMRAFPPASPDLREKDLFTDIEL
jgi:LmbE family N-acetylglucosaminyl deacetylase